MKAAIVDWSKENLRSLKDLGIALTALVPLTLIVGRACADIDICMVAVLFLVHSAKKSQWGWYKESWVLISLALWLYSTIRAAFIPDGTGDLFEAFAWLRYIIFGVSVTHWTVAEERGKNWLLRTTIAAVTIFSIDGFIQYVTGKDIIGNPKLDFRLTGFSTHAILGLTIANLFAPAIFWLIEKHKPISSAVLATMCLVVVFLSGDRMGLVLALLIMLAWFFCLVRTNKKHWQITIACACLFSLLIVCAPTLAQRQIQSTLTTVENIPSSAYGLVWKSAWQVGEANPFFGVGMRQFRNACPDEKFGPLTAPVTGYSRCYPHPHNSYMEWLSEDGFIGLLGFVAFALAVYIGLFKRLQNSKNDYILWGLATMLAVRLVPIFVSTSFFNNWSAIPFWLALGWAMSYKEKPASPL